MLVSYVSCPFIHSPLSLFLLHHHPPIQDCLNSTRLCEQCDRAGRIHLPTPRRYLSEVVGRYIPAVKRRTHFGKGEPKCLDCFRIQNKSRQNALETARISLNRVNLGDEKSQRNKIIVGLAEKWTQTHNLFCIGCRADIDEPDRKMWIIYVSPKLLITKIFCLVAIVAIIGKWILP